MRNVRQVATQVLAGLLLALLMGSAASAVDVQRTLALSGLTCAACSAAVTKALEQVEGVREVRVSEDRAQAVILVEAEVAPQRLVDAVTRLGYGARVPALEPGG
jgi:Cu+-exporting ATPase